MSGTKCNIAFAAHVFEDYKYSVKEEEVNKILPLRRPWRSQLDKTLVGGNPKQLKNNNDIMICNIKSSKNFSRESNAICYQQFLEYHFKTTVFKYLFIDMMYEKQPILN